MIWEYLILALVVAWAVYYLWRTMFQKKGCSCGTCPSKKNMDCQSQSLIQMCSQEEKTEKRGNSSEYKNQNNKS